METLLYLLSTAVLGIFLGAQICEAVLFVPYWKSLAPQEFFDLHKSYGKQIYKFFAPLTIVATVIPLLTAAYLIISSQELSLYSIFMAAFTLLFFLCYFIYFKQANKSFAQGSLSDSELPKALKKWGAWHWGRVVMESAAFICALLALAKE